MSIFNLNLNFLDEVLSIITAHLKNQDIVIKNKIKFKISSLFSIQKTYLCSLDLSVF